MTDSKIDNNRTKTLIGVSSVDGITPTLVEIDPETGELLVKARVTSSALPDGAATENKQDNIITAIEAITVNDVFKDYGLYAWEDNATNFYAMYQNKDDKWILIRISDTTGVTTYAKGTSGTSTAWTNRASQSFNDYATTF